MNNKPQKSWIEIQLAIAAAGLAATLVFWNLFSTPQKQVLVQAIETTMPPAPDPTQASTPTPGFIPVKIIFGGTAPKQPVVVQAAAARPQRNNGGGGSAAPQPAASTGSSKP